MSEQEGLVPLDTGGEVGHAVSRAALSRPDPIYHLAFLALCTGVILLAFVLSVRGGTQVLVLGSPLPELCLFRRVLGWGCPGCGMTRCFISLANGDLRSAWSYNPAGLLMFAIVASQIPFRLVQIARIRMGLAELQTGLWGQCLFGVLGVTMIGQWLLRFCGVTF